MSNIIAVIIIVAVFVLLPAFLPGSSYEQEHDKELRAIAASNWSIRQDDGCRVDLPHGKRVCAGSTLMGSTVRMEGY